MIRNETDSSFFNKIFTISDFVVFTETWSDPGDNDLLKWDHTHEEVIRKFCKRASRKGRSSGLGGIFFTSKKKFAKSYKILAGYLGDVREKSFKTT